MQYKSNSIKVVQVARKSLPSFDNKSEASPDPKVDNIFKSELLQKNSKINFDQSYSCVGLSELKQYLKKSKKSTVPKKNPFSANTSMKSYTIKSNDDENFLLTKQEVLTILDQPFIMIKQQESEKEKQKAKIGENRRKKEEKKNQQKSPIIKMKIKPVMYSRKHSSVFQTLNSYQKKVQKLKKWTLRQKKENISSYQWPKVLRKSFNLCNIFEKEQQDLECINRNGLRIKAQSKKRKQLQWIENQKQTTLFELVQRDRKRKIRKTNYNQLALN